MLYSEDKMKKEIKDKSTEELLEELEQIVKEFQKLHLSVDMIEPLERFHAIKNEIKKRCDK